MKKQIIYIILVFSFIPKGLFSQCIEDCVWPGDANANGIANHVDLLAIGLSFLENGPIRTNQSAAWEPLDADDWADVQPTTGANFKHADSNGDGVINWSDIEPITNNSEMTNPNFIGLWGNNFEGDDLQASPSETLVIPGSTFDIDLQLGDAINQMEDVYGIAFTLSMNSEYVESVELNLENSWLAENNPAAELISYKKFPPNENKVSIAISRIDGQPISGFGSIGRLEIVIVDVIQPLVADPTLCLNLGLQFENVLAINDLEEDLLITSNQDSVMIKDPSQIDNTKEPISTPSLNVFPNPVKDNVTIQFEYFKPQILRLNNARGQVVIQKKLSSNSIQNSVYQLSLNHLPAGIYYLECVSEEQTLVKKVVVQ